MPNWVEEAALEIEEVQDRRLKPASLMVLEDIIARHAPFKDGVAYMPVPRCDRCKHWKPHTFGPFPTTICAHPEPKFEANTSGGSSIGTEPDFGCVQWEAT